MGKSIVIVGGGAGGATAAARLRRLDESAEIIVLERGEYISYANCGLPYYVGGEITHSSRLVIQTPDRFHRRFNIDVRVENEVLAIDRTQKQLEVYDRKADRRYRLGYDTLILSPGASPVRPPLAGIDHPAVFTLRTIPDCLAIREYIEERQASRAVVVGGGFIGLEMTETLRLQGLSVTLVELAEQVMLALDREMAEFLHQHLRANGVELMLGDPVKGFEELPEGGLRVKTAKGHEVECDLVVLAIGVRPEVDLARKAGLEIGTTGGIRVNQYLQTSDPDIYAIGDAIETTHLVTGSPALIPLAGPANRQGRIVADTICGRPTPYPGTLGTSVVRVFDLVVASTGASEKALKEQSIPYLKSYTHPASHAGYYPGATPMVIKLLFSPEDGRILGAQVVGVDGVDKRIDVLAAAIRSGLTAEQLAELELAYAPPFGSAKDAVNIAGYVASNVLRGDVRLWYAEDLRDGVPPDVFLLDCRSRREYEAGHIEGAVNIPIDELRARCGEIPRDKTIWAVCLTGLRSYLACRILTQRGYDARNLSGGYSIYCAQYPEKCPSIPGLENFKRLLALETFCSTPEVKKMLALGSTKEADAS